MLLLIDNYDSFTYNLAQYLIELGQEVKVVRNDAISVEEVERMNPERIVISPGPKTPSEAGICMELIRRMTGRKPILGVCLGHQSMAAAYGGKIVKARQLMHGKTCRIEHDGAGVFAGLPNNFLATRYHSLVAEEASLPKEFIITARAPDGDIMGIRHKSAPVEGVQFHPESIICEHGKEILKNFLGM
ncbi:MAG: aminodeoxychorismate/anthranilate synthase component II [Nitrospinota bacterium]|nr:aminodeoxychorismate/anthranilate synthase component II [Nitrospinota bacterium]